MKKYTESQLEDNYKTFLKFIEDTFTGERQEKMLHMFGTDDGCLGLRALISPASSIDRFHNAYDGGYIDHVLGVCKTVRGVKVLLQSIGANIDFTDDEMMFARLIMTSENLVQLRESSMCTTIVSGIEKTKVSCTILMPDIHWMSVTDRSIWLLQHFEIKITEKEFLGISAI